MTTTQHTAHQQAYSRGYKHGAGRASWLWDGNTTDETYRTFLKLYDEGALPDDYLAPYPLSGEWAGESITELLGDLLDEEDNDGIMEAYEDGFQQGWWDELVNTATTMTEGIA